MHSSFRRTVRSTRRVALLLALLFVSTVAGPASADSVPANPTTAVTSEVLPDANVQSGLPPAVVKQIRERLGEQLLSAVDARQLAEAEHAAAVAEFGEIDPRTLEKLHALERIDRQIAALNVAIAGPLPVTVVPPAESGGWRTLSWIGRHPAGAILAWVGVSAVATIAVRAATVRGRTRVGVVGFYALAAAGVAHLFAAGVAIGAGRPAGTWATLVVCAAVLTFGSAALGRVIRRRAKTAGPPQTPIIVASKSTLG